MSQKVIITLDFSSSAVRAIPFSAEDGSQLGCAERRYVFTRADAMCREIAPQMLWKSTVQVVREIVESLGTQTEIGAVGLSFMGDTFLLTDRRGNTLSQILLSADNRSTGEAARIQKNMGMEFRQLTGEECESLCAAPRILWFAENRKELMEQVGSVWTIQQFILNKLGLPPAIDYSMASRMVLLDTGKWEWAESILKEVKIEREQLPYLESACCILGEIKKFGPVNLRQEVPVILGGQDTLMGTIGAGATDPGKRLMANVTGSYEHYAFLTPDYCNFAFQPRRDAIYSFCGLYPRQMICVACGQKIGLQLEKYMYANYGGIEEQYYRDFWEKVFLEEPDGLKLSPREKRDRDFIVNLTNHSAGYFFECEKAMSVSVSEVRITGGLSRTDKWVQLKANLLKKPISRMRVENASALGAAMVAAVSMGWYENIDQASEQMSDVKDVFYPK